MPDWLTFSSHHRYCKTVTHSLWCLKNSVHLQPMPCKLCTSEVALWQRNAWSTQFPPKVSFFLPATRSPSPLSYISLSLSQRVEVQIYGAVQLLAVTIRPEQVICSKITGTEDREGSINDIMDRSPGVCVCEKERNVVNHMHSQHRDSPSLMRLLH